MYAYDPNAGKRAGPQVQTQRRRRPPVARKPGIPRKPRKPTQPGVYATPNRVPTSSVQALQKRSF